MPALPDVNAVLAFLKRIDLCRGLNGQALGEIAFILLPVHAAEDEALIEEGDSGRAAFILYSGRLQVVKAGEAIGIIEPGEMFGEMSLLDAEPRSATLCAAGAKHPAQARSGQFRRHAGSRKRRAAASHAERPPAAGRSHAPSDRWPLSGSFTDRSGVVKCGLGGTTYSLAFRRSAFRGTCPPKRRCGTICFRRFSWLTRWVSRPRGSAARTFHWPSTSVRPMHRPCLTFRAKSV